MPLPRRITIVIAGLIAVAGCSASSSVGTWEGPSSPVMLSNEPWAFNGQIAQRLHTAHYNINTTIEDDHFLKGLAQVLEGSLQEYRRFTPDLPLTSRPMDCYIFANRREWSDFTRHHTGTDAPIYLKINRGGFTLHDWYVAYYLGDLNTYAVAAHEGWHQYVARHFKGRLPPFLEEGIACMFEGVSMNGQLPRWNLSVNVNRAHKLRKAIDGNYLYPLEELIQMHAGEIVDERPEKIEAFYAQNWAFARFMWEAEGGRYRAALQHLLTDTANGTVADPTHSHQRSSLSWRPTGVKPILEGYIGLPLSDIDKAYQAFLLKIAYKDSPPSN